MTPGLCLCLHQPRVAPRVVRDCDDDRCRHQAAQGRHSDIPCDQSRGEPLVNIGCSLSSFPSFIAINLTFWPWFVSFFACAVLHFLGNFHYIQEMLEWFLVRFKGRIWNYDSGLCLRTQYSPHHILRLGHRDHIRGVCMPVWRMLVTRQRSLGMMTPVEYLASTSITAQGTTLYTYTSLKTPLLGQLQQYHW